MEKLSREYLIFKLEIMQNNGEFEGHPENEIDFNSLDNENLFYYLDWINSDD